MQPVSLKYRIIKFIFLYQVYCLNENASSKHADVTIKILESVGICCQVPEKHMNAYTGLCGSAPAYVSEQQLPFMKNQKRSRTNPKKRPPSLRFSSASI